MSKNATEQTSQTMWGTILIQKRLIITGTTLEDGCIVKDLDDFNLSSLGQLLAFGGKNQSMIRFLKSEST